MSARGRTLSREQAQAALDSLLAAGRDGRPMTESGRQLLESHEEMRRLLVDADAEISHARHRGTLASEPYEVDALIAALRRAQAGWWR